MTKMKRKWTAKTIILTIILLSFPISFVVLGYFGNKKEEQVFFARKSDTPPLWVTDPQYWLGKKMVSAGRNHRVQDWDIEHDFSTEKAFRVSKTQFAFMRAKLRNQLCETAKKDAETAKTMSKINPLESRKFPFQTRTFWTEYTTGTPGKDLKLTVYYSCLVEGVHKNETE